MYCPNCQAQLSESDHFCRFCGTPLDPASLPPRPKQGSHWVPLLVFALLAALGLFVYFCDLGTVSTAVQPSVHSDTPWFGVVDGALCFYPEQYTGSGELTVPEQIHGQTVRSLSQGCFANCHELTSLHLPDTLETVGSQAFSGCSNLRGIYIPDSVTTIGSKAFYGCSSLEAVCISGSVTKIGQDAFEACPKLFYIFYQGNHQDWVSLYDQIVTPYTGVFCEDGSFYQGNFGN